MARAEVILRKLVQIIALGTAVVVDHVEDYADSHAMRVVHKAAEIAGLAVDRHRREPADAVVTPAESAWEIRHRHDLHYRNAHSSQLGQLAPRGFPRTLARECAGVHFVDHLAFESGAPPLRIGPLKVRRVDHL